MPPHAPHAPEPAGWTAPALPAPERERLTRFAWRLVALTLAYNLVEAGIALWAGEMADSIALIGFGLDSGIETSASALVLWHLSVERRGGDPDRIERTEHRVHRFVGATFVLLALYVTAQAGWTLHRRAPPDVSSLGIVLATASLIVMPFLAWRKLAVARALGSTALRAEAKETLACSLLSVPLFLGLVANAAAGWWWADPVAALMMVPWLLHEGRENLEGHACCPSPPAA